MAWNQMKPDARMLLNRVRGWETKGLDYWTKRLAKCEAAVKAADNSGSLGRALEQREIAAVAVRNLTVVAAS